MSNFADVKISTENIVRVCRDQETGINRELSTFKYVYKYLDNWADETLVGADVRSKISGLNDAVVQLQAKTIELCNIINDLVSQQENLNNGNTGSSVMMENSASYKGIGI